MILLDYVLVPGLLYLIASDRDELADRRRSRCGCGWSASCVLNTAVNYMGIEMTAKVNKIMLVGELVVLAIFIVIGVVALAQGKGQGFDLTPLYNADTFSWPLVFGAVSIAVLSSSASTASRCWPRRTRTRPARSAAPWWPRSLLAGVLFIVQTWVAALLVPDPAELISQGRPGGTAFYDAAAVGRRGVAGEAHRARDRDRLGLRQLAGRAGRHLPAAVRDGPRPAAAVVPAPRCTRRRACR